MASLEWGDLEAIPLSRSQQNIYTGVLQDGDPALYLVARTYRFLPVTTERLLEALKATVMKNPVQLCVLKTAAVDSDYPVLVPQLSVDDIVTVIEDSQSVAGSGQLERAWSTGILDTPLVRYVVRTDVAGLVCGLDAFTHHILLDGGATGIVEADLGEYLSAGGRGEIISARDGLMRLAGAHRREATKVAEAHERLTAGVQRELSEDASHGGYGDAATPGAAARGVLYESMRISGSAYDALVGLSDREHVPINVLVAAAAVGVVAGLRQNTSNLLIHATDNRFGDSDLDVATCLVNSVAQQVRFSPFASIEDVVRNLDRGYVRAVRRKWLREEHYRRMYLAINRTHHVEALTLNFLPEPCAPALRPHLSEPPVTTAIGPVETMVVAGVLDEEQRHLGIAIWDRADVRSPVKGVAARIGRVLELMPRMWRQPIALAAGEWFGVDHDGACREGDASTQTRCQQRAPAWFMESTGGVLAHLRRPGIDGWIAWLARNDVAPGDILVFTDDDTDKTTDMLVACHLAGCAYSVCDTEDEIAQRAESIAAHTHGSSIHIVDVAGADRPAGCSDDDSRLADRRLEEVTHDPQLAGRAAYIMPTSGSTGQPKLVRVSHLSLAVFCDAVRNAYGWGTDDTVLQCAPLTSDISVEEVFGAALCGSRLERSAAMKAGDFRALARDVGSAQSTVVDLPTAVWHLLCDDPDAMAAIVHSRLRQVIVGGEAIRASAINRWIESTASQPISMISTYGPTETTVVVTHLPVVSCDSTIEGDAHLRLGCPMVPGSVYIAFGEVVIVGELVADGYLGVESPSFGTVTNADGRPRRAFATGDRVVVDGNGFPIIAGRRDAVVKVGGRRVDTAEITRELSAVAGVTDVAMEVRNGRLGVWFETHLTRDGHDDTAVAARIRTVLAGLRVPSFFVIRVPGIPRKPGGKVDSDGLCAVPEPGDADISEPGLAGRAAELAQMWSRELGRPVQPDSSLLAEGVGSLDLIRILPSTRRYLGRHVSILDLISADTATHLVDDVRAAYGWMDAGTAAEIDRDLWDLPMRPAVTGVSKPLPSEGTGQAPIVVLGGSGILGTGCAEAVLERHRSGLACPEVILVTRSPLPERDPWTSLRKITAVRVELVPPDFRAADIDRLLRATRPRTVVNCVGNTNVLVPYRELRSANVDLVSAAVRACASHRIRYMHLSTFVVTGEVAGPRVTDPRVAPYPYAASKAMAELIVARSAAELDYMILRLPRVLGQPEQLAASADILVSMVDGCGAIGAYPDIALTEEVTTARGAADAIMGLVPEVSGSAELGRGIVVIRGQQLPYTGFLSEYGGDRLPAADWKELLDQSDWASRNPRRWSAVDAWYTLGQRLGTRSFTDYLSEYPTIDLDTQSIAEVATTPEPLRERLTAEYAYRMAAHAPISEEW
ncbi:AMP-binding protein [Mycolicibacterium helvum]|uniref:Peptide synthase n=1 Tax=Mycolicibacterium helvum TaxID=1534349 RepID=A0A7I7T8J9_9MYCO|nr:AMP-binding protein [Mycolicibacterium helvum]BBY65594.1 peptide synthase [Mycolicibacterium helvum]